MDDDANDMVDPDEDPQGSSRTVGGFCRGHAKGNAPAFADLESPYSTSGHRQKGQVFLHMDDTSTPYSITQPISSTLPATLHHASSLFSPIKNSRISVWKNGAWALKGRYATALTSREVLPWSKDEKGEWSVKLRAEVSVTVPSLLLPSPLPSDGFSKSAPSAPSGLSAPTSVPDTSSLESNRLSALQEQIKSLLGIPTSMTEHGTADVCDAYAKYKAVHQALEDIQQMKVDGSWTLGKVKFEVIVSIFMCKTTWYTHYKPLFPKVVKYPSLVQWLDRDPLAKEDSVIWTCEKTSYSLQDLTQLVKWYDSRVAKKEKRKRERESEKEIAGPFKKQKRAKSHDEDL